MITNTFHYSLEAIVSMELVHNEQKFLKAEETELLYVDDQDDTGEDRAVFGWGPCCPIELKEGVGMCKSFKIKHNSCKSVICESFARNYLAKHCFDSSNHPTHGDLEASFREANDAQLVMEAETVEDRKAYRNHCNFFAERKKAAAEVQTQNREGPMGRGRANHASRSPRRSGAIGSKGGKHKKGESRGAPIGAFATASGSSSFSEAVVDDRAIVARPKAQGVRIQLDELECLEDCLGRAIESQKRTIESLNFFSRMIQDERRVFTEAKNVIAEVIFREKLGRTIA